MTFNPQPKSVTVRDDDYREFIASQPCLICGCEACCHHEPLNGRGMGCKGPDNESLPLCIVCHHQRHLEGRHTFYYKRGIAWRRLVKHYQELYEVNK